MRPHIISVVAAFVTLAAFYLAGVLLLLDPVKGMNAPSVQLLPLPLAFVAATAVYIALFVWIERMIGAPFKAAIYRNDIDAIASFTDRAFAARKKLGARSLEFGPRQ